MGDQRSNSKEFGRSQGSKALLNDDFAVAAGEEEHGSFWHCLAAFEKHWVFQSFITTVIILNTIGLALEADSPNEPYWEFFDNIFLYIYTAELILRLAVYRTGFFCNADWRWNWFDFLIVLAGLSSEYVMSSNSDTGFGKLVMAMRMMRLLRIMRAFKIFVKFPHLQRLMIAMVKSIGSVGWIALFFFVLILVFSIFVTVIIGRASDAWEDPEERQLVEDKFGTLLMTMNTLAIYLTLDDWSESARAVNKVYPWMELVWVTYIILGAYMILSLLTGLMADQMADAREEMDAEDQCKGSEEIETMLQRFQQRFQDEPVTCDDFVEMLSDGNMAEVLDKCGVKVNSEPGMRWLFRAIDRNGDGSLTWEEFHEAFTDIGSHRENAAALREVLWLEGKVMRLDRRLEEEAKERARFGKLGAREIWEAQLSDVHVRSSLLRRRMALLESDLQDFFDSYQFGAGCAASSKLLQGVRRGSTST